MAPNNARAAKAPDDAVMAYKRILAGVLDKRPSGTRQRLASALGKNRSFVSHMVGESYATPIPVAHLDTIFRVCHFSAEERDQFLVAYGAAHPKRIALVPKASEGIAHTVHLPDLGDAAQNAKLRQLVSDFVQQLVKTIKE